MVPAGPAPQPRTSATAVYDRARQRLLVYGGQVNGGLPQSDVWALSPGGAPAWTLLAVAGTPPRRMFQTAVHDPVRDRLLVFGGWDELYAFRNDVWALSLEGTPTWNALPISGTLPSPRYGSAAVYDPVRDRMVIFGGSDATGRRNDVWALDLGTGTGWSQLTPSGPPPSARVSHRVVCDHARDRLVVFGGNDGSLRDDLWALSFTGAGEWTELLPAGPGPAARVVHSAVYDSAGGRMVVFAGGGGSVRLNDSWAIAWGPPVGVPVVPGPGSLALGLPHPNPARGAVALELVLPIETRVDLRVYDTGGREVRALVAGILPAGAHALRWDGVTTRGQRAPPGIYLVGLRAGTARMARRVVLVE